ncbi:hypothetical protein AB0I94_05405 [Streptomyces sp. NPDC050147]|uniref:hypothetical protein n=1 Tax=Streptomyces sp. NPDC050147 TaxID=3155513 RepID=UPI003425741C
MASLAWLLIPFAAAVGAGLWAALAARNRKSGKTGDNSELNGYAAFREAMEKPRQGS